jgi:SecD/SecF fusion protein
MKAFTWKIVICVVPVVLSALIVGYAYHQYAVGEGGFKLGVDLAGGTDLIYAIDLEKFPNAELPAGYNSQELASSLKRRIDPADLYNVTIRPVSNTRVEIILPTGGQHQAEVEESVWKELLMQIASKWPPKSYQVPPGHKTELIAQINAQHPEVPLDEIKKFVEANYKTASGDTQQSAAAWRDLLAKVEQQWKPVGYDVGRGKLQVLVNAVHAQYPEETVQSIGDFVDRNYKVSRERRHVSSEEVAHIKELISRVGSLEFRILANTTDDKEAIDAAKKYFAEAQKNPKIKADLDALAVAGKPPPPPLNDKGEPTFTTPNDGDHTYTWVELGMSERHSLGLNNEAANDSKRQAFWKTVADARAKGEAVPILGDSLLYSRDVLNPRLADKDADKKYEYFILTRDPEKGKEITGKYLTNAFETQGRNLDLEVGFRFNDEGGRLFQELTTKNAPAGSGEGAFHRILAVVLDGKIESAPRLNAIISTEGVIEGHFTKEEVDRLVTILRAGALPASLKSQPVSESTIGATLGEDTKRAGTISVVIAFAAVLIFMIVYYRFAGMVACVALLANLLMTVAFMVLVNATFTLPGLAGLVLMLGMAVDANVLIYERLREERDRGASLSLALRNGYDRAFPTIIDTHLTSIFTAIVLYAVGNDQLKGFGISLTVGLIISLFTSLYMTRLLFDIWQYKGWLKKLSMFRLLSKPNIDFMAIRYYWFTATIVLTVVGAAVFMYRLERGGLDIDFTKGTAYSARLRNKVSMKELRELLDKSKLPDRSVEQTFSSNPELSEGDRSALFTVRTSETDPNKVQADINALLVDPKDGKTLLKTPSLHSFEIDSGNKRATLTFSDPADPNHGPASASRAQVSMILGRQFADLGMSAVGEQSVLEGLGREEDGRFQWMELQLLQPIEHGKLQEVLQRTQDEFAGKPQPERLENFDSQLAKETQLRALYAILASWGAILLYLWFRFGNWTFGMAAVLCLVHDLFFTLGIIGFCHYIHEWAPGLASALLIQDFKINLASVAALLTLVGYSVSDTIVVFDRIREVRGKNPLLTPQMINDSVNQTLSRTLLTAFSVWLVVTVLYMFGGEGIHLFAFVMVIGVIVGTYSSIYIASPLLLMFGEGAPKKAPRQRQVTAQPATVS